MDAYLMKPNSLVVENKQEIYNVKVVLKQIAGRFIEMLKVNKLLAIECLFQFPSREIRDQILTNYDYSIQNPNFKQEMTPLEAQENAELERIMNLDPA